MFKMYSAKEVRTLVQRLKEEYDGVLKRQREVTEEIREDNRRLRARLSVLEGQRGEVSEALMRAVAEGERIKKEGSEQAENDRKELRLLAEKCRLLCDRLTALAEKCRLLCDRLNAKYPDEEDVSDFQAFTHSLLVYLGEEEQDEPEFDMEEVLNPKYPLDLSKLCRELGLMDEDA